MRNFTGISVRRCLTHCIMFVLFCPAYGQKKQQERIKKEIVLGMDDDPLISIGADRIKNKSVDALVDLFHSSTYTGHNDNQISIILETYSKLPVSLQRKIQQKPLKDDAFSIKAISLDPLIIIGTGYNARGTMYAAYKIADLMETGIPLQAIDRLYEPKIDKRFIYVKYNVSEGSAVPAPQNGKHREGLTTKSIEQLPLYGVNGVMLTDHPVMPWFPFVITDTLTYKIEPQATDLKTIFNNFHKYGMDVYLTYPYFLLPKYSFDQIEGYLKGKDLPGFIAYFNSYHEKRLEALFRFFPEIDGLNLGGPEATIGAISGFNTNGILRADQKDERSLLILENYLKVVQKVTEKYHKKAFFWTHNWGQTSVQIRKMREALYKFPAIGVLEDDRWNNSGWANLPVLGYLSGDLKKDIGRYNDYYMMVFSDAEGTGGGVLPTCIPDALYESAQTIIDKKFKGILSRIDIHDKTNNGSLFSLNEINFIASMAPLWSSPEPLDTLWKNWVIRRFGKKAAPELLPVLQSGKEIIFKGGMISGIPLLHQSSFEMKSWLGESPSNFRRLDLLLGKPGTPMLEKTEKDTITSDEYYAYQLKAKAVAIQQVRKDQERALALCFEAVKAIKTLKSKLKEDDYNYLMTTFNTTYYVYKGVRMATEALYYYNINKNNFDQVSNPEKEFAKALTNIRNSANEIKAQIGTPYFDQDFYYFPSAIMEYANKLEKKTKN